MGAQAPEPHTEAMATSTSTRVSLLWWFKSSTDRADKRLSDRGAAS